MVEYTTVCIQNVFLEGKSSYHSKNAFNLVLQETHKYWDVASEIRSLDTIHTVPLVEILCHDIKKGLSDRARYLGTINLTKLVNGFRRANERICNEYEEIKRVALTTATTTEELMTQLSFVENARQVVDLYGLEITHLWA